MPAAPLQLQVRKVRKCGNPASMRVVGRWQVRNVVRKCGISAARLSAGVRSVRPPAHPPPVRTGRKASAPAPSRPRSIAQGQTRSARGLPRSARPCARPGPPTARRTRFRCVAGTARSAARAASATRSRRPMRCATPASSRSSCTRSTRVRGDGPGSARMRPGARCSARQRRAASALVQGMPCAFSFETAAFDRPSSRAMSV